MILLFNFILHDALAHYKNKHNIFNHKQCQRLIFWLAIYSFYLNFVVKSCQEPVSIQTLVVQYATND